jgi:hypothetical protein
MTFRHDGLRVLPVVMLACCLLPAPAQAQFSQQGTKLVGTGALINGAVEEGWSVSLSDDGNTAIVGGRGDNNSIGAAWVYTRSGGMWSQQAKLIAKDSVGNAEQGYSVALSGDGNTALVGGPMDSPEADIFGEREGVGAAWVFTRSNGVWSQQAKLVASDAVNSPFPAMQGYSVSLSNDGNTAIVGGVLDNNAAGAAWVYTRLGGVWSEEAKLVGTDAAGNAAQGYSVSLSRDANTAIVGGPADDGNLGAAWVFARSVFAGTPGKANCYGQSVSALARQFKGLNAAAAALGFASVPALQDAILAFCGG